MLNILCDVNNDVIDKYVYVWWIWSIGWQPNSFENDCMLKLLHRRVDMLDNILVNVLGTVDMMWYY